jgi:hypothetical protein
MNEESIVFVGSSWIAAAAVAKLPVRSCFINGEAIVCDANRLAALEPLRRRWRSTTGASACPRTTKATGLHDGNPPLPTAVDRRGA